MEDLTGHQSADKEALSVIKIAIISDIHANLPALKAVLDDIDLAGFQHVYCLGDLTDAAPWHNEVIDLIRDRNILTIMGNHDERIAFDLPVFPLSKHTVEEQEARLAAINYTKASITKVNRQFLSALPDTVKLNFRGVKILLVHGSPDSNEEYIYRHHDEADLQKFLDDNDADIMVCGHTHLSFIKELALGGLVINAGSVGRTKEANKKATYLQLNISNEHTAELPVVCAVLRKVDYDLTETLEGIRKSEVPDFYADFLQTGDVK